MQSLLAGAADWTGTASELLLALGDRLDERQQRSPTWPKSARALANRLRQLAPHLRTKGIGVTFEREAHTGRRLVHLILQSSESCVTCVTSVTNGPEQGFGGDDQGDDGDDAAIPGQSIVTHPTNTRGLLEAVTEDAGDDGDAGDDEKPTLHIGQRVNTPQGPGVVWQVFLDRIGVELEATGRLAFFKPEEVTAVG